MNYINKISALLLFLVAGVFASCERDNEGAIYNGVGVTFSCSALTDVAVPASDPTFTVDVYRTNGNEALSGTVSLSALLANGTELAGCTASGYSFAAGETKTTVTVNVDPLDVGVVLNVTLTLPDDVVSIGGIASTSLSVNKEYTWIDLGTGTYTDNWGWGITYNVPIQKADGFDRYRVIAPYAESMVNDDAEWENWLATSSAEYVEFWTESDNTIDFKPIWLGVNYQGDSNSPIYAYPPTAFSGISAEYNKWIDSKTAQLAPYYYVPALGGGWNKTQEDGIIIITLP